MVEFEVLSFTRWYSDTSKAWLAVRHGSCCEFLGEYKLQQYTTFENRPTFVKVMNECIVAYYLFHSNDALAWVTSVKDDSITFSRLQTC